MADETPKPPTVEVQEALDRAWGSIESCRTRATDQQLAEGLGEMIRAIELLNERLEPFEMMRTVAKVDGADTIATTDTEPPATDNAEPDK